MGGTEWDGLQKQDIKMRLVTGQIESPVEAVPAHHDDMQKDRPDRGARWLAVGSVPALLWSIVKL